MIESANVRSDEFSKENGEDRKKELENYDKLVYVDPMEPNVVP